MFQTNTIKGGSEGRECGVASMYYVGFKGGGGGAENKVLNSADDTINMKLVSLISTKEVVFLIFKGFCFRTENVFKPTKHENIFLRTQHTP